MIEFPFDTTRAVADLLLRGGIARHPEAAVTAITAAIRATPLLDQDQITAMLTTNGLPLLDRFGT